VFNVGATVFGTVRGDLEALIAHAGTASRLRPIPARPAELALRALELAKLSPLGEWHYKTASRNSFVDVSKGESLLDWHAAKSNVETLVENYDWYVANRAHMQAAGVTHRVPWNQQALGWLKRMS
jgi:nucleoside-diphosphate-sugar epimerase